LKICDLAQHPQALSTPALIQPDLPFPQSHRFFMQGSLPEPPVAHATPSELPEPWRSTLPERLADDEHILAWLRIDLDARLRYSDGLIVLTNRRWLAVGPDPDSSRSWPLRPDMDLRLQDHAGVGTLELLDSHARLARWRYTLGHHPEALRLAAAWQALRQPTPEAAAAELPLPEQPAAAPRARALFRLWRFARPYRRQLATGLALTFASTAASLVPPYLTMPLMDDVLIPFQNGVPINYGLVMRYLSGLLGASVLAWGLGWARSAILAWVSERIGADLRTATYQHLQRLSLQYFGGKRTGDLIARIGSESDRICLFLSLHLLDFVTDILMIGMTTVVLLSIDPWLTLATLALLPFIAWMIHWVRDRLRHGFEKADRVWAEITNVLADTIPGIRVVKAFAQERREVARFREANNRNLAINDRVNALWSLFSPTVTLLTELGLLIVWIFGIWLVSRGAITVGVLTAFLAYISRFYVRLDSMSRIVSTTQRAAVGAKRIFDILDHTSSVPESDNPRRPEQVRGHIELRHIRFRYGNRTVIHDLSLDIAPGEMIGLVGHSGSGKSTLVNLICRFYDVSHGSIRLDGLDIRQYAIADYRRNIGLVLQEPFLFYGTIAENIAYGRPDASPAQIVAAARAAHAHEFILRLPQGYDSLVGERGQALSGGERQRISIARALLIDPPILILDEATSSVDTATENEIQKALDNLVRGRTTISIAHRLSTLREADRLVVMDGGRIVEIGRHDELLAREGAYARLYQAQLQHQDEPSGEPEGTDLSDEAIDAN
jgi:ATP-binding cassette subfamily B protein